MAQMQGLHYYIRSVLKLELELEFTEIFFVCFCLFSV